MKKILLILIAFSSFSFAGWTEFDCSRVSSKLSAYHTIYEGPLDTNGKCYESGETLLGIGGARFSIINDNNPSCTSALVTVDYTFECNENGNYGDYRPNGPENSIGLDENGKPICNDGFSNSGDECLPTPDNSNGYTPDGEPDCTSPFVLENGFCILPSNTNPNGTCYEGYYKTLNGTCEPLDNGDTSTGGDTGTGGSTGGDTGTGGSTGGDTGTGGSTGGDTGTGGSTGGDTGTGGLTGGDTGTGGSTGGDTGTGGSTGGDTGTGGVGSSETVGTGTGGDTATGGDTETGDNGETTAFICPDGGKSTDYYTPGFQTCDRTCESIGLVTDNSGDIKKCIGTSSCPEGQTQTGTDLLGNPICYAINNETDLKDVTSLLDSIKTNTSFNKSNNTQLGTLNNNTIKTNAKLEAVKGGLAVINTSVNQTNAKLEAVKGGLALNNTSLNNINNSTQANTGLLQGIGTMMSDIVSPMSSTKESEYQNQINSKLTSTLNDSFTKYSNVLGFGSYGSAPQNITVTLYSREYTLIDFSLLDDYVSIIRSLFLSLAYLVGFMIFLRGGK